MIFECAKKTTAMLYMVLPTSVQMKILEKYLYILIFFVIFVKHISFSIFLFEIIGKILIVTYYIWVHQIIILMKSLLRHSIIITLNKKHYTIILVN